MSLSVQDLVLNDSTKLKGTQQFRTCREKYYKYGTRYKLGESYYEPELSQWLEMHACQS